MKKQLTLSEKLKRYSLLTTGALATAVTVEAQVIYTDVNPDYSGYGSYDGDVFLVDLNNDGITDFSIIAWSYSGYNSANLYWSSSVVVDPAYGNSVALVSNLPQAIDSGIAIGTNLIWADVSEPKLAFDYRWVDRFDFSSYGGTSYGNFLDQSDKFLGVRFSFNGEQHYGWIRLSINAYASKYTVHDYAYETSANTVVTAGDIGCPTFYIDTDDDFFGDANDAGTIFCYNPGAGFSTKNSDCDDSNAAIYPTQHELCNSIDDNCNGSIDEGILISYYHDADGDTYGDAFDTGTLLCTDPGIGFSSNNLDCNDANAAIHPVPPAVEWQKCLGGSGYENAYSVQQTSDGGFIVGGSSSSNDGDVSGHHGPSYLTDYWIAKIDSEGNIEWQKSLGGSSTDEAYSVQQTSDGGFIVGGSSGSIDGDVSGHHGPSYITDYWIAKIDSDGNSEWQKSLGGSNYDDAYSIQQTIDGGFILAGNSYSNDGDVSGNHGGRDSWIVKLDTSGNIQWQKSLGGSSYDDAYSIQQTIDGGFIVAGNSYSNDGDVSGHHGSSYYNDYWIVKLADDGTIAWQKSLGGTSDDYANSIQQTSDGGFIVAGYSSSNDGDVSGHHGSASYSDYWIVKLNDDGTIAWQKSLGGTSSDHANSIQQTSDGGFIVAGYSWSYDGDVSGNHGSSDYWIIKLEASGNIEWQKPLGGSYSENANFIQQTLDEGFIAAGYSYSNSYDVSGNHGNGDYWIVKLSPDGQVFFLDADGDGYGNADSSIVQLNCINNSGYVVDGTDCNDVDASINPGVTEICNNIDDNCNGSIDDGLTSIKYWADADGDGYGNKDIDSLACAQPIGYIHNKKDCDDYNPNINPSATEICNNLDDNCNGSIDDGLAFTTYYADADGDTYGDASNSTLACTLPNGYVTDNTDCDDNNAAINPAATEICNNIDDNCNGSIDDGLVFTTYYADADGDNYGDASNSIDACAPVSGYITDNADCDDNNAAVNPAATEICNNLDDNCNGSIDDGLVFTTYYADADGDNYGDASNSIDACAPVSGYLTDNTDCDDNNSAINPSATEICDDFDDDCNGAIDDGLLFTTYYRDADGDNYGDANNSVDACTDLSSSGYITDNTDCDDNNPNVNPGALEIPNNGIDDNCNGDIDEFGVGISSFVNDQSVLSVFPNPTDGAFTLLLNLPEEENSEAKIEVLNLLGQIIISEKGIINKGKLHEELQLTDAAAEGMYLVKVIIGDQVYSSQINYQK